MATGRTLRSIFVRLGFDIDSRGLNSLEGRLSRILGIAGNIGVAVAGIGAGLYVGKSLLGPAGQIEQAQIVLETLTKSAEKAKVAMDGLFELTQTTPFKFEELLKGATNLISVKVRAEDLNETLIMLGDIAAGSKASFETVVDLYAQIKTGNQVYGQQLRRFRENALPVILDYAEAMGISTEKAEKMFKAGKITFSEFDKLLRQMTSSGGRFHGLMQKLSLTLFGQKRIIEDIIFIIRAQIGETLLPLVEEAQKAFVGFLNANRKLFVFNMQKMFLGMSESLRKVSKYGKLVVGDMGSVLKIFGGLTNVIRVATLGLLAFSAIKIISALGNLASAMLFVGNASLIMQTKMLAVPLLTGAAFLLLGGILADIAGYFTDRDSLTGYLIDVLEKKFPASFNILRESLRQFKSEFLIPFKNLLVGIFTFDKDEIIANLFELGRNLKSTFAELGRVLGIEFRNAFNGKIVDPSEGFFAKGKTSGISKTDVIASFFAGIAEDLGLGPYIDPRYFSGATSISGPTGGQVVQTQNNNITIQAQPGTTQQQAAEIAGELNKNLGKLFKTTNIQTAPSHR